MNELIERLRRDYPNIRFIEGKKFAFRYPKTIRFCLGAQNFEQLILHELGHALLGHKTYALDVERLKMEVDAWEKARELADDYGVVIDDEIMQEELDSYRDWLHQKSRCPGCGLTRFQTPDGNYHCPRCENF